MASSALALLVALTLLAAPSYGDGPPPRHGANALEKSVVQVRAVDGDDGSVVLGVAVRRGRIALPAHVVHRWQTRGVTSVEVLNDVVAVLATVALEDTELTPRGCFVVLPVAPTALASLEVPTLRAIERVLGAIADEGALHFGWLASNQHAAYCQRCDVVYDGVEILRVTPVQGADALVPPDSPTDGLAWHKGRLAGMVTSVEPGAWVLLDAGDLVAGLAGRRSRPFKDLARTCGVRSALALEAHGAWRNAAQRYQLLDADPAWRAFRAAWCWLRGRGVDQAMAAIEAGLAAKPSAGRLRLFRADIRASAGDHEGALKDARGAIANGYDAALAYTMAARYLFELDRLPEARRMAEAALRRDRDDPKANEILALALERDGLLSASFLFAQRAARDPSASDRLLRVGAEGAMAVGEWAVARKALERVRSEQVKSYTYYTLLGRACYELGAFDPAIAAFDRALEKYRHQRQARFYRAMARLRIGKAGVALEDARHLSAADATHVGYAVLLVSALHEAELVDERDQALMALRALDAKRGEALAKQLGLR